MSNTEYMKSSITVMTDEELDNYIFILAGSPPTSKWLKVALVTSFERDILDMLHDVECLEAILKRRFQIATAKTEEPCIACIVCGLSDCPTKATRKGDFHNPRPQVSTDLPTTHDTGTVRQFLLDIMSTAIEGGINDWAGIGHIDRDKNGEYLSYQVRDYEDRGAAFQTITPEKIEEALKMIASAECLVKIGDSYRYDIIQAYSTLDAGMIDAMLADIIVQVAAYDEIVFG